MNSNASFSPPVALVTGATAGLGLAIGRALLREGYQLILVARDPQRLNDVVQTLSAEGAVVPVSLPCDVSDPEQVGRLCQQVDERYGRLDVLVNVVGTSDRGMVVDLGPERVAQLITANVVTALLCSQACLPLLERSGGCVVNIGSLASKVGARFLGGYPLAKHALAGLTQQMRLEWRPRGVHVGLISPGPIRRADAGRRYEQQVQQGSGLPAQAAQPGGGTRVKGLPPERVAQAVVRMIRRRSADVILPWHLRPLVAIGHCWPALGDWLLLRFTSSAPSRTPPPPPAES
ncbi:SDR family NAD(P)-dependent oxidoreductase [Roseimaritima sediminicola]|uniref:SDR family NAD(P)-dependent oxidoreductase n=1 Tax=Roseimaritima sediminicola TaxID=2662066 RepID=UPI0013871FBB|nr:SDR family oxidoreductase [Roseimaritima sediminicola]